MKLEAWHYILIAIVAIVIIQPDILDSFGGTDAADVIVNPTPTAKTVTLNMRDAHNFGTSVTGDQIKVYKNGELSSDSKVTGGTVTADDKDELVIYAGHNSSAYYTKKMEYTVGEKLQQIVFLDLCAIDTGVTMTWYNADDTANTAVAVGTGGEESFDVKFKAASDKCYGNPDIPNSAGAGFKYNTTSYTSIELDGAGMVSCPNSMTAATAFDWECYEFDYLEDGNRKQFRDQLTVEAGGSVNPSNSDVNKSAIFNITMQMIDKDYDFDARTDTLISAFEDEDRNDLGDTSTQSKMIDFS